MKGGRQHRVPIGGAAAMVLEQQRAHRTGDFIFPGAKAGAPLSNMALAMALRRMKVDVTGARLPVDVQGLVERADGVSGRAFRNGAGARRWGQDGGGVSARRPVPEAGRVDGRVERFLRHRPMTKATGRPRGAPTKTFLQDNDRFLIAFATSLQSFFNEKPRESYLKRRRIC